MNLFPFALTPVARAARQYHFELRFAREKLR